uniref:Uncharacterized protein n=1 Tax=Arcella intermedia TaxID=1963864 RepID=A0A6B2L6Z4_9EUKA
MDDYKYHGADLSILVELFLRRFWNWCMLFLPEWIAPNLVTTIGFVFLISNFILGLFLCGFGNPCDCNPGSAYFFLCAWNVFFYQLMDNLDGKQARRTGSSSALGELFDHGCDSLFITSMTISLGSALRMNPTECFYLLSFGVFIFYAAHWEEFHTNKLVLGKYANPTEGQVGMMIILIIAGIFGPEFYTTPFGLPGVLSSLNITKCIVIFTALGCAYCLIDNGIKVLKWSSHQAKPGDSTLYRYYYAFSPILPILLHQMLILAWGNWSPSNIITTKPIMFYLFNGFISSFLCNELVVCRVTKMPFGPFRPILLFPVGAVVNLFLRSPIAESLFLDVSVVLILIIYTYVHTSIVLQLAYALKIKVFKLTPKQQ